MLILSHIGICFTYWGRGCHWFTLDKVETLQEDWDFCLCLVWVFAVCFDLFFFSLEVEKGRSGSNGIGRDFGGKNISFIIYLFSNIFYLLIHSFTVLGGIKKQVCTHVLLQCQSYLVEASFLCLCHAHSPYHTFDNTLHVNDIRHWYSGSLRSE